MQQNCENDLESGNNQNVEKTENKNDFWETFLIIFGILFLVFIIVGSIVWFVYGIIFLVKDYDLAKECSGSNLWAYVLVAVILYWQKANAKDIGDEDMVVKVVVSAILDFGLAIWGATELFDKVDGCSELENSNLWKFGLGTFIIQIMYSGILIIIMISLYLISKYTSSENISEPLKV